MATSSFTVLFLILGVLSCVTAVDYIDDVAMFTKHQRWMSEYGRVYKDAEERQRRFEIFRDNFLSIEDFNNAGPNTYRLGLNQFSDMTLEEFVASHRCIPVHAQDHFQQLPDVPEAEPNRTGGVAVPDNVDWRSEGVVNTPKNQKNCGSCWAFAASAAVEALIMMNKSVLYDLSPQQLVDCDNQSDGCEGGYADKAFMYIAKNGITTEAKYPYKGSKGTCKNVEQPVVKVTKAAYVLRNNEEALKKAVARQPVVVTIDGESFGFKNYKSGIFRGPCSPFINHVVLVVGYGTWNGEDYWILKNSWGTSWGVGGYMFMKRNTVSPLGMCGIAAYPTFPIEIIDQA